MEATIQDHKNGVQYNLLIICSLNFCSLDQIRTVDFLYFIQKIWATYVKISVM
jgi:hypothetical protein